MTLPSSNDAWLESSSGTVVPLRGNCSLGRSSENHVVIASERVSRRHAIIHAQDGGEFWLADLGSSNGTFINERRLVRPTLLRTGDIIGIGHERLTFHSATAPVESDDEGVSQMTVVDVRTEPCWLLVADIEDFTGLSQRLSPDELAALVGRWVRLCKEQIEGQGGVINKYLGDGFIAFWHEEPGAAEQVARAMQGLLKAHRASDIKYRIILHYGQVALGGTASMGEESLMGPEVNFVFRMEKVASVNKVAFCLSGAAQPHLASLLPIIPMPGEHELKGFSGTHRFFALEV